MSWLKSKLMAISEAWCSIDIFAFCFVAMGPCYAESYSKLNIWPWNFKIKVLPKLDQALIMWSIGHGFHFWHKWESVFWKIICKPVEKHKSVWLKVYIAPDRMMIYDLRGAFHIHRVISQIRLRLHHCVQSQKYPRPCPCLKDRLRIATPQPPMMPLEGALSHVSSLQWRHNGHYGASNHQPHHCLLNRWFGQRSKKTSKLRVTGLCEGNSPVTCAFLSQRASNAVNVSIWCHHVWSLKNNDMLYHFSMESLTKICIPLIMPNSCTVRNINQFQFVLWLSINVFDAHFHHFDNDRTTFRCFPYIFTTEPLPVIQIDPSTFADDWLAAFKDQRYTDVLFVLGSGTKIRVHKIVLCAASSFFADVLKQVRYVDVHRLQRYTVESAEVYCFRSWQAYGLIEHTSSIIVLHLQWNQSLKT